MRGLAFSVAEGRLVGVVEMACRFLEGVLGGVWSSNSGSLRVRTTWFRRGGSGVVVDWEVEGTGLMDCRGGVGRGATLDEGSFNMSMSSTAFSSWMVEVEADATTGVEGADEREEELGDRDASSK